ncbi:MAG: PQQ-binding-like beta-propeller repeat protein [Deltaproteobacteria bacterium]|nr:PQQ-binding-like beta-propeller repeat protein [Deltaproteobacteria bacterium]
MTRRTIRLSKPALTLLSPLALLSAGAGFMLMAHGCGGVASVAPEVPEVERVSLSPGGGGFRLLAEGVEEAPSPTAQDMLDESLAGTAESPDEGLGSRMTARPLRVPHPPRGATAQFNFDGGKRGWVTALPNDQLLTSPAFQDGRVYLGGGFASHRFYALNAYTGESEWTLAAPDGGPTAAIVLASTAEFPRGSVIFNTESCTIFCADSETGELRWKRWLGDPLMSQPAAAGDLVISAYPANGKHRLGAFRVSDGEPVWNIEIEADVIQAPHVRGADVFVSTMDGSALRVRARDGHVFWRRAVGATSPIWVDGDRAMLTKRVDAGGSIYEQPIVLDVANGRVVSRGERQPAPYLAGTSRDRQLAAGTAGAWGGVPHGEHLGLRNVASGWAFQGSTPTVSDGRAYQAIGGKIVAREIATGEKVWERVYREAEGAQAVSPPAIVGSQLVFGTVDGKLYFSDIDTGMTIRAYDVGAPIVFQPIVAQGWVYIATATGNLIGLEVGDPALDGWHMWGGNAGHSGPVEDAGRVDPALLANLARPGQGSMQIVQVSVQEPRVSADPAEVASAESESESESQEGDDDEGPATLAHRPMAMVHMSVDAQISGYVARVKVTQRFDNPADVPVDARYLFPLPADAAVDDMQMHIGRRVIRAHIRGRSQARQIFEQARATGHRAALLEQQRPNLFAQSVANIPAHQSIEVELSYVVMLPYEDGHYEFAFPMVAPPRFDPSDPAAVLGEPGETRQADGVELHLQLDAGMPLLSVSSPTHTIDLQRSSASQADISLAAGEQIPNRDFVLRYAMGGDTPEAALFATRDDERGHFSLVLQPPPTPQDAEVASRHVTFLVDASSSMRGRPMAQAGALVSRMLAEMRPDDRFDLLAFNDRVTSLGSGAASADAATIARADAWLEELRPVGSTAMRPAVEEGLRRSAADATRLGLVVLVTDGYVGNEAEVLRAIAADLGQSRLYTLGVGSAVNRFLLERASEMGRGRSVVSTLSEAPEVAAERLSRLIAAPVFTDVRIDWGGLAVQDVYPRRLPDVFSGAPLVVHGRFTQGGSAQVKIRGTYKGRRYERVVSVSLPEASTGERDAEHATLWARAAVHERMNSLTLREDPEIVDEVRMLGLRYRMVTPYTSFVAVDETPDDEPDADESDAEPEARATLSPGRTLPGDPEIRVPAPADALAVTVILPFGETVPANYEPRLGMWTARFLVPADAEEGTYPVYVRIALPGGEQRELRLWYTVDASAPELDFEVEGDVVPGAELLIHARQRITRADLQQVGQRPETLSPERAVLLSDANGLELTAPDGHSIEMREDGPGAWVGRYRVPDDASGELVLSAVVVDLAANVRSQTLTLTVRP